MLIAETSSFYNTDPPMQWRSPPSLRELKRFYPDIVFDKFKLFQYLKQRSGMRVAWPSGLFQENICNKTISTISPNYPQFDKNVKIT